MRLENHFALNASASDKYKAQIESMKSKLRDVRQKVEAGKNTVRNLEATLNDAIKQAQEGNEAAFKTDVLGFDGFYRYYLSTVK